MGSTTVPIVVQGNKRQKTLGSDPDTMNAFLENDDVWVNGILPFVGLGSYAYVAGVNKSFKAWYEKTFATPENPPLVRRSVFGRGRPATVHDTFRSAIFSSLSCAKFYWNEPYSGDQFGFSRVVLGPIIACDRSSEFENLRSAKMSGEPFSWCKTESEFVKYPNDNRHRFSVFTFYLNWHKDEVYYWLRVLEGGQDASNSKA